MQRRKFVVGLGSLAAGTSAVMGTGAFSQMNQDRNLSGNIVADGSGSPYIDFMTGGNPNGVHAEINNARGELQVTLDDNNNGGSGLSYDSEYWFNNVFSVRTHGTGNQEYNTWFETDTSRVIFYVDGHNGVDSKSNPQAWHETSKETLTASDHLNVGIYVNLNDVTAADADSLEDLAGVHSQDSITFRAVKV